MCTASRRAILELPSRLGLPYDLTIHDFYPYCPIHSLSTPEGGYCGEPDAAGCARCVLGRPHPWGLEIGEWRERMHRFLAGAARVIVPSRFVAGRLARHFPDVACHVRPHPPRQEWLEPARARVKVGLLGGLAAVKGLATVLASARLARDLGSRSRIACSVTPSSAIPTWPELPIQVRGEYRDADLPELLALERFDVLWFPGRIPETYSYTLDVALASGLPIVASDLGAVAERLRDAGRGTLLPADAPAERWNEALLAAAASGSRGAAVAGGAEPASRLPRLVHGPGDDGRARRVATRGSRRQPGSARATTGVGKPPVTAGDALRARGRMRSPRIAPRAEAPAGGSQPRLRRAGCPREAGRATLVRDSRPGRGHQAVPAARTRRA